MSSDGCEYFTRLKAYVRYPHHMTSTYTETTTVTRDYRQDLPRTHRRCWKPSLTIVLLAHDVPQKSNVFEPWAD